MTKTRYLSGLPAATITIEAHEIECVIDTGFDGALMLPISIIQECNLRKAAQIQCLLADGTLSQKEVFDGEIIWLGQKRKTRIVAMDTDFALIGMKLLTHARTTLQPSHDILTVEPV